jgi:hypothetical protein
MKEVILKKAGCYHRYEWICSYCQSPNVTEVHVGKWDEFWRNPVVQCL